MACKMQTFSLIHKAPGGANSAHAFLKRYFNYFVGTFLLFLGIDFS